jgi:protein gp37
MLVYALKQIRFDDSELKEDLYKYGKELTIFIGSSCDMFAENIPDWWLDKIFNYLKNYSDNTYLFQSKNPSRFLEFWLQFPKKTILGTTIETNRITYNISMAPSVYQRAGAMKIVRERDIFPVMLSIEPIVEFDIVEFVEMVRPIDPKFISIGADSKGFLKKHNIPQPSIDKVNDLVDKLEEFTVVKIKSNIKNLEYLGDNKK